MKKILLFIFVCIALSACNSEKDEVGVPDKEYAGTVTIDKVLYISDDGVTAYVKDGKRAIGEVLIPDFVTIKGRRMPVDCIYGNQGTMMFGYGAFSDNRDINKVVLSGNIKEISYSAFYGCNGLRDIQIPNSVIIIGRSAFERCNSMTSVAIPNSVTNIGAKAFSIQGVFTDVIIGASVKYIGENAFLSTNTKDQPISVYVRSKTPPIILNGVIFSTKAKIIVYVPEGTKELYASSEYWKDLEIVEYPGDVNGVNTTN